MTRAMVFRFAFAAALMLATGLSAGGACAQTAQTDLCRQNPAFAVSLMRTVIDEQLKTDHDPSLDDTPPEQLAQESADRAIKDCAQELARSPVLYDVMTKLPPEERQTGWDAYNIACADHVASKPDCVRNEVASDVALKHMIINNKPPGAKAIIETCQLLLPQIVPLAEWRACTDTALLLHATEEAVQTCKNNVPWHSAHTGAEGGKILADCLNAHKS